MNYRQCILKKKIKNATLEQTSYIPEPFCKKGKILKLKDEDGNWDNGWEIVSVGEPTPAHLVEGSSQDYKKNRDNTDISRQKRKK